MIESSVCLHLCHSGRGRFQMLHESVPVLLGAANGQMGFRNAQNDYVLRWH